MNAHNSSPLVLELERLTLEQANERARRSRAGARSTLPVRVLAVTPLEAGEFELEVVGEAPDYRTAIAKGSARVLARSRFDRVAALVVVCEASAAPDTSHRPSEHPERREIALSVAVTLEEHPVFRARAVEIGSLAEMTECGDGVVAPDSPLTAQLERVATHAETFRAMRKQLGADAPG